jgi:hypothetical protein
MSQMKFVPLLCRTHKTPRALSIRQAQQPNNQRKQKKGDKMIKTIKNEAKICASTIIILALVLVICTGIYELLKYFLVARLSSVLLCRCVLFCP